VFPVLHTGLYAIPAPTADGMLQGRGFEILWEKGKGEGKREGFQIHRYVC